MTAPVLHTDVLDSIGREIAAGERVPGEVLTLAALEQRFGVSRTVVREAVRVLESLGLVRSRRRVGVTVLPEHDWSVLDARVIEWRLSGRGRDAQLRSLTELRIALEPAAARLAARSGPAAGAELERLAGHLRALGERGLGDTAEYLEVDVAFHTVLMTASGNEMFAALQDAIVEVLSGRTRLGLTPPWPAPHSLDDHQETARAIAAGDEDAAELRARAVVMEVWHELGDSAHHPPPPPSTS